MTEELNAETTKEYYIEEDLVKVADMIAYNATLIGICFGRLFQKGIIIFGITQG